MLAGGGRMNRYGHLAMQRWQTERPDAYAQTENPESFFAWRGEQIAARITALTSELAGPDVPGETDVDRAARRVAAVARATRLAVQDSGLTLTWTQAENIAAHDEVMPVAEAESVDRMPHID